MYLILSICLPLSRRCPPLSTIYKQMLDKDEMPENLQKRPKWPAYETEEGFIAVTNFIKDVEEYQAPFF